MQWALLKTFRKPAVILEEFVATPDAATSEEVDERVQGALLRLKERPLNRVSAVVVLSQKSLGNGAIGRAMASPIAARVVHCPLEGFEEPTCAIRAVVHTLGHVYGLPCCHSPGCVMTHWGCCVYQEQPFLEPRFCQDCAATLLKRMGAELPQNGGAL